MVKIYLTIIFFAISINSMFGFVNYGSKTEVGVGKSPSKIFSLDDKGFFVVCLGQDIDYDFVFDEGEELPSLWYVSYNKNGESYFSEKKYTFDSFTNYPYTTVRFGVDEENKALYVPLRTGVISLSLEDFTILDGAVSNISAYGLEYIAGHLLISYNDANSNGKLTVVNLANNQVLQTLNIGVNLQETIYFPSSKGISIAALSVGPFGESNSKVFYGAINHKFDFALSDSVLLGNTGNHLQYSNGKIYATVNMSHLIKEIDPVTHAVRTFHTGTSGYNGPRESMVFNNKLYVSTYAEDVRIFNLETGSLESIIDAFYNVHLEGLSMLNDSTLAVSAIFKSDYTASNLVLIYQKIDVHSRMIPYNVGTYPIWVEKIDGIVNVICAGNDKNDNGVFDEGEDKGSWWTLKNNIPEKKFEFSQPFNFFPIIDRINKLIFIPHKNVVKSYSYEDFNVVDDAVANINTWYLETAGGHLLIAKPNENKSDTILVLNLSNGMILQKLNAGGIVYGLKYYPDPKGIGLAYTVLDSETKKYKLMYGPINHMVDFHLENSVMLDSFPSQLIFKDGKLITISHINGMSYVVDVNTKEVSTYNFAFQGNDLSATIGKYGDYLAVATMQSDVRAYNLTTNELEVVIPIEGKAIYMNNVGKSDDEEDQILAICSPFDNNNNISNKLFLSEQIPTNVEDKITYENVKVFPNPAQDYIQLDLSNINYQSINIKVYDNKGNIVKKINNQLTDKINIKELNSGSYFININLDNDIYNLPLKVVR